MSKRISNHKGRYRKTPARSRVKYGWRRTLNESGTEQSNKVGSSEPPQTSG